MVKSRSPAPLAFMTTEIFWNHHTSLTAPPLGMHESRLFAFTVSRVTGLGLAFGIAGSVFATACGAAIKYISGKVEEERSKFSRPREEPS